MNHIDIDAGALRQLLKRIGGVTPRHPILPVFANIKITVNGPAVEFAAADIDLYATASGDAIETSGGAWRLLVNKNYLARFAAAASGPVRIETEGDTVTLSAGQLRAVCPNPCDPADFPPKPDVSDWDFTLDGDNLLGALRIAGTCASIDDPRKSIAGVLIERDQVGARIVGTDGKCLVVVPTDSELLPGNGSAILPKFALLKIKTVFGGKFAADDRFAIDVCRERIRLRRGGLALFVKPIEAVYPNWKQVIPPNVTLSTYLGNEHFRAISDAVSIAETDFFTLKLEHEKIIVSAQNATDGYKISTEMECATDTEMELMLTAKLFDRARLLGEVVMMATDCRSPLLFRNAAGARFVFMPRGVAK